MDRADKASVEQAQRESWKAALSSKPSVSTRRGTANRYEQPYEDTSTLVLTAPSGKFVDIRFPLKLRPDTVLAAHPQFWGFTGVSTTAFYDAGADQNEVDGRISIPLPYTAHSTYTHEIDSKGDGVTDEGDFVLLPNGDAMEIGIWPDTGQLFKELWTEPDILQGREGVIKSPVVVAETVEGNHKGRGRLVRIGDYVQGIFAYDDLVLQGINDGQQREQGHAKEKVLVQRLARISTGNWHSDERSNTGSLDVFPREILLEDFNQGDQKLALGVEFESQGNRWIVTELVD